MRRTQLGHKTAVGRQLLVRGYDVPHYMISSGITGVTSIHALGESGFRVTVFNLRSAVAATGQSINRRTESTKRRPHDVLVCRRLHSG